MEKSQFISYGNTGSLQMINCHTQNVYFIKNIGLNWSMIGNILKIVIILSECSVEQNETMIDFQFKSIYEMAIFSEKFVFFFFSPLFNWKPLENKLRRLQSTQTDTLYR